MAFRVGQKVVCVDASPDNAGDIRLALNALYTIGGFDPETGDGVYLVEVPPRPHDYSPHWRYPRAWKPSRFRPVVERKTDISIFTKMLNPSKEHVRS